MTRKMQTYTVTDDSDTEETIQAESLDDALRQARDWMRDEWSDSAPCRVYGVVTDPDGDDHQTAVVIDPPEPPCTHNGGHKWAASVEIEGGLTENPGAWGHGGGARIGKHCARAGCAVTREMDTWASDHTGEPFEKLDYGELDEEDLALKDKLHERFA